MKTLSVLLIGTLLLFQYPTVSSPTQYPSNSFNIEVPTLPKPLEQSNETNIIPALFSYTDSTELIYPKPSYIPTLKPINCYNKNDDLWHPCSPSDYIQPDNHWVQYYAKNDIGFNVIYRTDDDIYNYPANGDIWQNADYTLFTGYGDCEDIAIAQVSIDIAKGKKAVVVGGYVTLDNGQIIKDFWEEIYTGGIKNIKGINNPIIVTQKELRVDPLFMFNDKISWRSYDENWYNI